MVNCDWIERKSKLVLYLSPYELVNSNKSFTSFRPSPKGLILFGNCRWSVCSQMVVFSPPLGPGVPSSCQASSWWCTGAAPRFPTADSKATFATIITIKYLLFILYLCSVIFSTSALHNNPVCPTINKAVDNNATVRICRLFEPQQNLLMFTTITFN